jgi:cysteinyl-tRNA synthetase
MKNVFSNIAEAIGNTPLVRINRLNPNPNVTIYIKLESRNPGGSIKDRPALAMIEAAEKSGDLKPGKIIIEATSGNTGIGLAMVAAVKGYRIILAMAETASIERQRILKALGAELLLTPGNLGTDGAIEEVYRMVRENPEKYFLADQFNNPANPAAHYERTGPEIYAQTDGKVDLVICGLGTSGTAMGLLQSMKELNPKIKVVGIEPFPGHKIQGMKNMKESYVPGIFNRRALDQVINIKDEDAFEMARRLAREEGIFVGMSSGAAVVGAIEFAKKMEKGIIVAIAPDSGERYLSTNLFTTMLEPDFKFFNFPDRKKVQLKPLLEGKIRISITRSPLDKSLGLAECRRFLTADLLTRFLKSQNFAVKTATLIPDWDVSTIQGAFKNEKRLGEYTNSKIKELQADFQFLNMGQDFLYLKTSEYEENILRQIRTLLNKRMAYESMRSLYFNLSQVRNYGELSKVDLKKIRVGSTVDLSTYEKQNPRDFTLLKRATLAELKQGVYLKTEWGNVLPTLHIATTAVSMTELGNPLDIYMSSVDFLFPHLENVRTIAEDALRTN